MVTSRALPKAEPFILEQVDTTLIPSGNRADGTASAWTAIWKFQVPSGQAMVLGPDDHFKAYLEDASAEVGDRTCRVRISVRDNAEHDDRVVFGPVPYIMVKEYQDLRKVARLGIPEAIEVSEQMFIVISAYDDGAVDESDSAFNLSMTRIRQGLR